jgi:hypothetical protein
MRFLLAIFGLVLAVATAPARDFSSLSNDEITAAAGAELREKTAELVPTVGEARPTLDAVVLLNKVRAEIFEELQRVRKIHEIDNILLADTIDDSLVYHLGDLIVPYTERHPEPILNAGTEKFRSGLDNVGFVGKWATGLLVHLELQQTMLILADFRANRSEAEVEAAEDAFLRHFSLLTQLYRAQHQSLEDLHSCNLANLDWTIGRLESENGTHDFVVANRFFASRENGFAYLLKLASPTTGETMDVFYPLPYLTQMDEGWQQLQGTAAGDDDASADN